MDEVDYLDAVEISSLVWLYNQAYATHLYSRLLAIWTFIHIMLIVFEFGSVFSDYTGADWILIMVGSALYLISLLICTLAVGLLKRIKSDYFQARARPQVNDQVELDWQVGRMVIRNGLKRLITWTAIFSIMGSLSTSAGCIVFIQNVEAQRSAATYLNALLLFSACFLIVIAAIAVMTTVFLMRLARRHETRLSALIAKISAYLQSYQHIEGAEFLDVPGWTKYLDRISRGHVLKRADISKTNVKRLHQGIETCAPFSLHGQRLKADLLQDLDLLLSARKMIALPL